jgi:hypothetical protein
MSPLHQHVLQEADKYAHLAKNPVVAWDCLGAERWANELCDIAQHIAVLSHEEGLAYLKELRAQVDTMPLSSDWGLLAALSRRQQLDELIDPVAKEPNGHIVISTWGGLDDGKMSVRPAYRRMLGVNHCVASCGRERGESDAQWLERRDAWLAQYHPEVRVIRDSACWTEERAQYTAFVCNVQELRALPHLEEHALVEGLQFLRKNGFAHSLRVVHAGPLDRDDEVRFLVCSIPQEGEARVPPGTLLRTKHGLCEVVA